MAEIRDQGAAVRDPASEISDQQSEKRDRLADLTGKNLLPAGRKIPELFSPPIPHTPTKQNSRLDSRFPGTTSRASGKAMVLEVGFQMVSRSQG